MVSTGVPLRLADAWSYAQYACVSLALTVLVFVILERTVKDGGFARAQDWDPRELPALPEAMRYTGLMIANAMAIAQREMEAGAAPARAECERLRELLRERPTAPSGEAARACSVGAPRTTATMVRPSRVAEAAMHQPASSVWPVLMPSAPG